MSPGPQLLIVQACDFTVISLVISLITTMLQRPTADLIQKTQLLTHRFPLAQLLFLIKAQLIYNAMLISGA